MFYLIKRRKPGIFHLRASRTGEREEHIIETTCGGLFSISLLNLCQKFSTLVLARAVDGVADDALLIDHDGEGEALGTNPRHHVLGLDEVRPCEVVLVGNPLG